MTRESVRALTGVAAVVLVTAAGVAVGLQLRGGPTAASPTQGLPLKAAGSLRLPGGTSRFDYASPDRNV